jgi:glycosyltransferase involved in cell wall biosynthesis
MPMTRPPHIRILLCTLNGAAYLDAQLASFLTQTHEDWSLWVSDDGSTDATREILDRFAKENPSRDIRFLNGPGKGMTANYMSLICHADLEADFVALSDQDDVWLPEKLARAVDHLSPMGGIAAYGATSLQVDAQLNTLGTAPLPSSGDFANAMVQNVLAGNTILLNRAAIETLRATGVPEAVPYHDWWIYMVLTGAGGQIILDQTPVLKYRQHGDNAFGARMGAASLKARWRLLHDGSYGTWLAANHAGLHAIRAHLTPEAAARLDRFKEAQTKTGFARARAIRATGARRQSAIGRALFYAATLIGRV